MYLIINNRNDFLCQSSKNNTLWRFFALVFHLFNNFSLSESSIKNIKQLGITSDCDTAKIILDYKRLNKKLNRVYL